MRGDQGSSNGHSDSISALPITARRRKPSPAVAKEAAIAMATNVTNSISYKMAYEEGARRTKALSGARLNQGVGQLAFKDGAAGRVIRFRRVSTNPSAHARLST
jgi:hypothetical protein